MNISQCEAGSVLNAECNTAMQNSGNHKARYYYYSLQYSISLLDTSVIIVQVANESKEAEKNVRILPKKIGVANLAIR